MEAYKTNDKAASVAGSAKDESDIAEVETAGETTAAATGAAEIGAATGQTNGESAARESAVGADTMVKVADATDSTVES